MRNRAKCKKCNDIIESYHASDYVSCTCDEISVFEGAAMKCAAKDFSNFVRVDDEGNEIITKFVEEMEQKQPDAYVQPTDFLKQLEDLIRAYDGLPDHSRLSPVTNMDMQNALMIIYGCLLRK